MTCRDCRHLVLASRNPDKVEELAHLLASFPASRGSLSDYADVRDVAEIGVTSAENARLKAVGYARQIGQWVLADDTALEVDALGGAPGVLTARFAGQHATMTENRSRLLSELADIPDALRLARFICHLALANPAGGVVAESVGICAGRIRREAVAGPFGFGYDGLFEVAAQGCTLAELDREATARVGHRGRAVRALLEHLVASPGRG